MREGDKPNNLVQRVDPRMRYEDGCAVWDDAAEVRAAEPERADGVSAVRERIDAVAQELTAKVKRARGEGAQNTLRGKMRPRVEAPVVVDLVERARGEERKVEDRGAACAPAACRKRALRRTGRPRGRRVTAETEGLREMLRVRVASLRPGEVAWIVDLHEVKKVRQRILEWVRTVKDWRVERRPRDGYSGLLVCVVRAGQQERVR